MNYDGRLCVGKLTGSPKQTSALQTIYGCLDPESRSVSRRSICFDSGKAISRAGSITSCSCHRNFSLSNLEKLLYQSDRQCAPKDQITLYISVHGLMSFRPLLPREGISQFVTFWPICKETDAKAANLRNS